jgi:hypothetical protein
MNVRDPLWETHPIGHLASEKGGAFNADRVTIHSCRREQIQRSTVTVASEVLRSRTSWLNLSVFRSGVHVIDARLVIRCNCGEILF